MDQRNTIIMVIVAVIILIVGVVGGMAWQKSLSAASLQKLAQLQAMEPTIKSLSTKMFPSIVAYGNVTKIEGRNITLTSNAETITIPTTDNTYIYTVEAPTKPAAKGTTAAPTQQRAQFSQIKTGNNVSVAIRVLPTGGIEALSVMIIPLGTK